MLFKTLFFFWLEQNQKDMNKFKPFVGIDVSKKTFDAALLHADKPGELHHQAFAQTATGYALFAVWLRGYTPPGEAVVCLEHTGLYITGIVQFLGEQKVAVWVEMPLRLKKCTGLQRGGDDKVAAIQIAQYAFRYQDRVQLWQPVDASLEKLRHYISQRDRLVSTLTQLTVPVQELEQVGAREQSRELARLQAPVIRALEKSIEKMEAAIDAWMAADTKLSMVISRVSSIKGVGKQTAVNLYVYTKGFTQFRSAKQLACYCGVVPFAKSSGTSVRYKPEVSPFANRKRKKLLHLCALAALRFNDDMKRYYERKVAEGKNKMSVINAVRNKLIHRIFAVVRDDRKYVNKMGAMV